MLRSLVGSEMCIRDRYQRRVRGPSIAKMVMGLMDEKHENKFAHLNSLVGSLTLGEHLMEIRTSPDFSGKVEIRMGLTWSPCFVTLKGHFLYIWTNDSVHPHPHPHPHPRPSTAGCCTRCFQSSGRGSTWWREIK
eukprot:TRINITY_DN9541_c0_g1_i2.p1 TRINITY_DN9541_c0_g1~~TRINITY_DN9541_c0_g1_i2.p1  ORF type:complete len:135 (+),score=28.65 TRINITY_DN9541_c0_g1_i2:163-567(+)